MGLAGAVGQVLILRDLLVLFCGNELSVGLALACWLLWSATGSGIAGRAAGLLHARGAGRRALAAAVSLSAFLLPASILWIRAARSVWSIAPGEAVSPFEMLGISVTATGPFCLVLGFVFTLAWTMLAAAPESEGESGGSGEGGRPTLVYLYEAAGAGVGGLCFYFVLLPRFPVLTGTVAVSILLLAGVSVFVLHSRLSSFSRSGRLLEPLVALFPAVVLGAGLAGAALLHGTARLEELSRRLQWGPEVVEVRDSPHGNIAVVKRENQYTFFGNGLWLFSAPDPETAEPAAHIALLQHRMPRLVLAAGGGMAGIIGEILKYGDIVRIDYVEPDPEIIRMGRDVLPSSGTSVLGDPRVRIHHEDAAAFIRRTGLKYDVALLDTGEPMNAGMNRFYTVEFYRRLKGVLNPGGIVSFAVSTPTNIIGPAQAQFLRSIHSTLRSVFPDVFVYPGGSARFLACAAPGELVTDPLILTGRILERGLALRYVREDVLFDSLNPMRLGYMASVLGTGAGTGAPSRESADAPPPADAGEVPRVNRDFHPTCYFNNLLVWSVQLHPWIYECLSSLMEAPRTVLWIGAAFPVAVIVLLLRSRSSGPERGAAVGVMVAGATLMVLEIVLLLAFQIIDGNLYTRMALIISFFMGGLAAGAGLFAAACSRGVNSARWFLGAQGALCVYPIVLLKVLLILHGEGEGGPDVVSGPVGGRGGLDDYVDLLVFSTLAMAAGVVGGVHFPSAVRLAGSAVVGISGRTAGNLYALDLVGAAVGATAASLLFIPLYGLETTLILCSLLNLGCVVGGIAGSPRYRT